MLLMVKISLVLAILVSLAPIYRCSNINLKDKKEEHKLKLIMGLVLRLAQSELSLHSRRPIEYSLVRIVSARKEFFILATKYRIEAEIKMNNCDKIKCKPSLCTFIVIAYPIAPPDLRKATCRRIRIVATTPRTTTVATNTTTAATNTTTTTVLTPTTTLNLTSESNQTTKRPANTTESNDISELIEMGDLVLD